MTTALSEVGRQETPEVRGFGPRILNLSERLRSDYEPSPIFQFRPPQDRETLARRLERADEHLRAGRRSQAMALYQQTLADRPGDRRALNGLARIYAIQGQRSQLLQACFAWLEHLQATAQFRLAEEVGESILRLDPESEKARLHVALCRLRQRNVAGALRSLRELALLLLHQGRTEDSMTLLERAWSVAGGDPEIGMALAEVYILTGSLAQAAAHLRGLAAGLLSRGQDAQAVEVMQRLTLVDPDAEDVPMSLGRLYCTMRCYDEAIAEFRSLLRRVQDPRPALLHLAEACILNRQYEDAALAARKLMMLEPDSREARSLLGTAYLGLGKVQEANELLPPPADALPEQDVVEMARQLLEQAEQEQQVVDQALAQLDPEALAEVDRELEEGGGRAASLEEAADLQEDAGQPADGAPDLEEAGPQQRAQLEAVLQAWSSVEGSLFDTLAVELRPPTLFGPAPVQAALPLSPQPARIPAPAPPASSSAAFPPHTAATDSPATGQSGAAPVEIRVTEVEPVRSPGPVPPADAVRSAEPADARRIDPLALRHGIQAAARRLDDPWSDPAERVEALDSLCQAVRCYARTLPRDRRSEGWEHHEQQLKQAVGMLRPATLDGNLIRLTLWRGIQAAGTLLSLPRLSWEQKLEAQTVLAQAAEAYARAIPCQRPYEALGALAELLHRHDWESCLSPSQRLTLWRGIQACGTLMMEGEDTPEERVRLLETLCQAGRLYALEVPLQDPYTAFDSLRRVLAASDPRLSEGPLAQHTLWKGIQAAGGLLEDPGYPAERRQEVLAGLCETARAFARIAPPVQPEALERLRAQLSQPSQP